MIEEVLLAVGVAASIILGIVALMWFIHKVVPEKDVEF